MVQVQSFLNDIEAMRYLTINCRGIQYNTSEPQLSAPAAPCYDLYLLRRLRARAIGLSPCTEDWAEPLG